jgi:hypothetical protein
LRLLGRFHRLALAGEFAALAAALPTCGGTASVEVATAAILGALEADPAAAIASLDTQVQTNEVARAAGLMVGLAASNRDQRPTRLIEIGCSAGLNLRFDQFDYRWTTNGATVRAGGGEAAVRIEQVWDPQPTTAMLPPVTERIGLDPHPVDPATTEGRLRLLSFIWPDQLHRFERTDAAIELARTVPATIRATNATAETLGELLAGPPQETFVFHSIVWQYIDKPERQRIHDVMNAAGRLATADARLHWFAYEPDLADRSAAALTLRSWDDQRTGEPMMLGRADYHGRWVHPTPHDDLR